MKTTRFRLGEMPSIVHWDGSALHGTGMARSVIVTVPLRLTAVRCEHLPPAAPAAIRAAARLKAERAFAALGPVAIDAIIAPPSAGAATAVLFALPQSVLSAIRNALQPRAQTLVAVRIAELAVPVPVGGVAIAGTEACLVAAKDGWLQGVAALGATTDPGFADTLARERLRLGVDPEATALAAPGEALDFLHPTIMASEPLLQRPGMRIGLLVASLAVIILIAGLFAVGDAIQARSTAQAEALKLRPLAKSLTGRRAELAEVAPWFDDRSSPISGLAVLSAALPPLGGDDQVRLVRVRQVSGEDAVAEATAADRGQMMAFLERLRRDPRVAAATIRSSRNPSKEAKTVVFELIVRLAADIRGGAHAAS